MEPGAKGNQWWSGADAVVEPWRQTLTAVVMMGLWLQIVVVFFAYFEKTYCAPQYLPEQQEAVLPLFPSASPPPARALYHPAFCFYYVE